MKKFSLLFLGLSLAITAPKHSYGSTMESITDNQTSVYNETAAQYQSFGPLSFAYTLAPDPVCGLCQNGGVTYSLLTFDLPGFTYTNARFYPNSGGFDGFDVDGLAPNGDVLVFGEAFPTGSLFTQGTHLSLDGLMTLQVGVATTATPEPRSLLLVSTAIAIALTFWGIGRKRLAV